LFFDYSGLDPELTKSINAELFAEHEQVFRIEQADIILVHVTPITIEKEWNCKAVLCPCTNTNHITDRKGVKIISLKDCKDQLNIIDATVHHTLYLILNIVWQQSFRPNAFMRFIRPIRPRRSLNDMSLGIVGMGRIGRRIEAIGHILGFKSINWIDKNFETCTKEHLLKYSDIITIHALIEPNQKPILGEMELDLVKSGAFIINTSRGEAIDEKALKNHLPRLGGFACDTLCGEPHPKSLENLLCFDNVFLSPHIGGYTYEDLRKTFQMVYKKLKEATCFE